MSDEQRLGGPFYFYIPLSCCTRVPIFLLAIVGTLQFIATDASLILAGKRLKNWLTTKRFALSTADLAATSLNQLKTAKSGSEKSDLFFHSVSTG